MLLYLEAAARMELAGIFCPNTGGSPMDTLSPVDTGASPMDTGAEREVLTNCQDPLEGSFCHISTTSSCLCQSQSHPQP